MINQFVSDQIVTPTELSHRPKHAVAFVGSDLSFSDRTIRLFNDEFSNFNAIRVTSLADLHLFVQIHPNLAFVYFDESHAPDIIRQPEVYERACEGARIVLTYRDCNVACSVLQKRKEAGHDQSLGFLPMERSMDCWLAINSLLMCGENYIPPEMVVAPLPASGDTEHTDVGVPAGLVKCEEDRRGEDLTVRETEVLENVAEGKQNKIIAGQLRISEHTVKLHIHNIIRKLGVSNRTAASAWYLSKGKPSALPNVGASDGG